MPGQFVYHLIPDVGATGRLEVTIYKNGQTEGELVWSKAQSGKYIKSDYPTFLELVKQAL